MGRGNNRRTVDDNETKMPQVPKYDIKKSGDDIELANEMGDRYVLQKKPGFGPTGVRRKDNE